MIYDCPAFTTAEVTIIGTGGGYGESCVIHLGNNEWIIVDSCINPITNKSLPLEYLQTIGVDIETNVKLIVCTHWHDDHIIGISQLFKLAKNAKFCMAKANDQKKFLYFVGLDYTKNHIGSLTSFKEFTACIEIIKDRKLAPIIAIENRLIFKTIFNNISCSIACLSPSDTTMNDFDIELSQLINGFGTPAKKFVDTNPNSKSVTLFLKLNMHRALLGADLEVDDNKNKGWFGILNSCQGITIDDKASLFKIPHHGSQNAYHERVWKELIQETAIAGLTPWNRNTKLPQYEMLQMFCAHTSFVYMTSKTIGKKPKERNKVLEKMIRQFKPSLREVKYQKGIIRNRINLQDKDAIWQTTLHDAAFHVNKELSSLI